jgi:hypothetical protein
MRSVILHGHIFKNAGTSFDWSLRRQFGKGFLDHRDDRAMRAGEGRHLRELVREKPGLCAVSSHHMTGELPDLPDVRFLKVFLLRHPLERLRSVYEFERRQPGQTPGSRAARSKSFSDYVAWRMSPDVAHTIRNYQTLYLAGFHGRASDADLAAIYFPAALEALSNATLVGLVDRYDESMVVLEDALRPHFPDIDLACVPQNVGQGKERRAAAEAVVAATLGELGELQKTVIDNNSYDLALYQLASQALREKIAGIGDFKARLADYRARCKRLSTRRRKLFSFR